MSTVTDVEVEAVYRVLRSSAFCVTPKTVRMSLEAAAAARSVPDARRWRHKKRGTTYTEVGRARLQWTRPHEITEDDEMVIYRSEATGDLWCRVVHEFEDGRFEEIAATERQVPQAGEVAEIVSRLRALDLPWRHEAADMITGQAAEIAELRQDREASRQRVLEALAAKDAEISHLLDDYVHWLDAKIARDRDRAGKKTA